MDIQTLIHVADFNFNTAALGELRCGPLGNELSKFDKMARDGVDGVKLARALVLAIGHKLTENSDVDAIAGGPSVTEDDVALLSKSELDDFCDKLITLRLRRSAGSRHDTEQGNSLQKSTTTGCAALGPAIIAHTDSQRAQMDRFLGQARTSILGRTAFDAIGKNAIGDTLKGFRLGETIAEQVRKFQDGGIIGQLQRDALNESVLGAALRTVKASDNLGETIAALRASNTGVNHFATPVEPSTIKFDPPHISRNPILETNELLRKQQSYSEEMRPTIIRAAELIQTLTDSTLAAQTLANDNSAQAERHARRSMWVAVFSIFIAVITGGISIYYAKLSPTAEQLDLLAKNQRMQISAMAGAAHADAIALEKKNC